VRKSVSGRTLPPARARGDVTRKRKRQFRLIPIGWTAKEVRAFYQDKLECYRIIAERSYKEPSTPPEQASGMDA